MLAEHVVHESSLRGERAVGSRRMSVKCRVYGSWLEGVCVRALFGFYSTWSTVVHVRLGPD
eukprot:1232888-Rhodomonas_salina.1